MFKPGDKVYWEDDLGERTYREVDRVDGAKVYFTNKCWMWDFDLVKVDEDTSKHHKHHDLIIAWAKGAEIQGKGPGADLWINCPCPAWHNDFEYRIKPSDPHADEIGRIEEMMRKLADRLKKLQEG